MAEEPGAEGAFAVAGPDVDDLGFRGDQDEMRDAVCLIGGGKARAHRLEFIPLDTIRLFLLQDYLQDFFQVFSPSTLSRTNASLSANSLASSLPSGMDSIHGPQPTLQKSRRMYLPENSDR